MVFVFLIAENSFAITQVAVTQTYDTNAIKQWQDMKTAAASAKSDAQGNATACYIATFGFAVACYYGSAWYCAGAAVAYWGGSTLDRQASDYQTRMNEADDAICRLTGCKLTYTQGGGVPTPAPLTNATPSPNQAKALAALNSNGFKFNPDPKNGSLTFPNGKVLTAADAAAGNFSGALSPAESNLLTAKLADVMNKAKEQVAAGGADKNAEGLAEDLSAGGAGGVAAAKGLKFDPNAFAMPGMGKFGAKSGRLPASVAGMTKKLANGESIGVAGDSIFGMMTRRYEAISSGDKFIGN